MCPPDAGGGDGPGAPDDATGGSALAARQASLLGAGWSYYLRGGGVGAACLGPRPARLHRVTDHLSNRTPAPPQAAARAAIASALAAQTTEAASLGPRTLAQLHATAAALHRSGDAAGAAAGYTLAVSRARQAHLVHRDMHVCLWRASGGRL